MEEDRGAHFDQPTEVDRLERIRQNAIAAWEKTDSWSGLNRQEACRVGMRAVLASTVLENHDLLRWLLTKAGHATIEEGRKAYVEDLQRTAREMQR